MVEACDCEIATLKKYYERENLPRDMGCEEQMSKSKENSRNIHVNNEKRKHTLKVRWPLMVYDLIVYAVVVMLT